MLSNKFFGSIRTKMAAVYLVVTILALIAISFTVTMIVESFLVAQRVETQLRETTRLALEISPEIEDGDTEALFATLSARAESFGGRVLFLDTNAVVQADSASYQLGRRLPYREVRDVLTENNESSYGFHKISRTDHEKKWEIGHEYVWAVYYTSPVTVNGAYVGVVLVSTLIEDVEESVSSIVRQIGLTFIVVIAVMCIGTFLLSGFVTKPISELTAAIRKMERQPKGVRVDVKGSGEMRELGEAFNRMSEQLEDHDRIRDEFVSNASHELKTPLATMKILSESILYEENPDPALMREFFGDVNHEVDRLSGVITDLLRLVRFDEDEARFEPVRVELDRVVEAAVDRLRPLAKEKKITLTVTDNVQCAVWGESVRLGQLVTNLVENAIKYTDAGAVTVKLVRAEGNAVLSVTDSGIGIPKEAIPHLFERFYRVDKARSRSTGGTGLGLAIVEKIVSMHSGTIAVESELGRGSTFTVRIPLYEAKGGEAE